MCIDYMQILSIRDVEIWGESWNQFPMDTKKSEGQLQ